MILFVRFVLFVFLFLNYIQYFVNYSNVCMRCNVIESMLIAYSVTTQYELVRLGD